ncbi:MAG: PASTA domain-containing protein [candidate division WOR-3 bacterium]
MKRSKRGRRNLALAVFLFLLVLGAILVVVLNWVVMPLVVGRGREVVVPNVVGMSRPAAETALAKAGLVLGEVRHVPSATVAAENVVGQSPAAGRRVKRGREVALDISRGAGRLRMPHTEGLSVARAMALLEEIGLIVDGVESLRTSGVPVGQVVGTRPSAGTEVLQGDHVMVQVSSRIGAFPMPNLVGTLVETAQGIIASQGLVLGELRRTPSDEPVGSVLVQYPEEGMSVRAGDTVHLIVASGAHER